MNAHVVRQNCRDSFVLVTRHGEDLKLEPLFPDEYPLTDNLVEQVREHKPQLLSILKWEEQADVLLLESTERIAAAWTPGCDLEGPVWESLESDLTAAYWSTDLSCLKGILAKRETFATAKFESYRREVRHA